MPTIQFTLTVNEGKWLIAHAIAQMPQVCRAMAEGRVVFKAGTTVSCVSQILLNQPLRICGRVTARGTVSSKEPGPAPHCLMYEGGSLENLDDRVEDALLELGPKDVLITGANLIDNQGGAAMLAGSPGGGRFGRALSAMTSEGFQVIVAAGLEKLSPVPVSVAMNVAGRKGVCYSRGMSCGLVPIIGHVITEIDAIKLLANVEACLIGRGGICGAEGGCVFQISGAADQLERLEQTLDQCRNQPLAGESISLIECSFPCSGCGRHLSCSYKFVRKKTPCE